MMFSNLFQPLFKPLFQPVGGLLLRNFRTNSGTTDYVQLASAVTLAGDFEVDFTFSTSVTGLEKVIISGNTPGGSLRIQVSASGLLQVANFISAGSIAQSIAIPTVRFDDGKLYTGKLRRVGSAYTLSVGTASASGSLTLTSWSPDRLLSSPSARFFVGTLSDVRITSAGVPIHFWPMNEGSGSTHVDVIGGNNGTIINGTAGDWERFERLPSVNEWVGKELAVPPVNVGTGWTDLGGGEYSANGPLVPYSSLIFGGSTGAGVCRCKYTVVSMASPAGAAFNLGSSDVWDFTLRAPGYERNQILPYTAGYLPRLKPTNLSVFTIRNISIRRILEIA